jgi:hypothetical protein
VTPCSADESCVFPTCNHRTLHVAIEAAEARTVRWRTKQRPGIHVPSGRGLAREMGEEKMRGSGVEAPFPRALHHAYVPLETGASSCWQRRYRIR